MLHKLLIKIFHDWFGWHNGKAGHGRAFFDGCTVHSWCSICGKEVLLDSQGNWFTFE